MIGATTGAGAGPLDLAAEAVFRRGAFVRYVRDGPVPSLRLRHGRRGETSPRVTVIIPTADGRRGGNLARLLAQLDEQTLQEFEVIIVEGDRRQGRAINTAAAIARGEFLVTFDDDTRLGPADLLEQIVSAFDANDQLGIIGVANLVPPQAPWIVRRAMLELPRRSSRLVAEVVDSDMAEHPCLGIRRDLFYRVGGEHERIPRGLDPYLRREVRRLGYRVAVIPHAWIHHLLPPTLTGMLRQYFRNGVGAAYVKRFYPEMVIDQPDDHQRDVPQAPSFAARGGRYLARLAAAVCTLRLLYLGTLVAYAGGYVWGLLTLREGSL